MTRKPGDHPDDWRPHPGPQTRFLGLTCFEALFGGAAGGGKSDCLLVDAIRYVGRGYGTSYQALLLRRTFPELEKNLILRSHDLYPRIGGRYNQQSKTWTFPGGERVLFGYMEHDEDRLQYQGAAFQFVGFDETTHFSRVQYLYLFSRCRSAKGVPCRIRGATNPGGRGHEWVFQRFGPWLDPKHPQPAQAGEVRYFLSDDKGHERQVPKGSALDRLAPDGTPYRIPALGRTFVPAKLEDNPTLLADPTYQAALDQLDPVTRAQLRHGNWLTAAGKKLYFDRAWVTMVDAHDLPADLRWVRAWDLAATEPSQDNPDPDWTRGVKMARWNGGVVIGDVASLRGNPGAVDAFLLATARADGHRVMQVLPLDPGAGGKIALAHYQAILAGYPVSSARAVDDKLTRFRPFSGYAAPPKRGAFVVRAPWTAAYLDELEAFEGRPKDRDDQVDATSDAFNHLSPLLSTVVHAPDDEADPYRFAAADRRGF